MTKFFAYGFSVASTGLGVFAEVAGDNGIGATALGVGSAALLAAVGAILKDYWTDRRQCRSHEIARLRLQLASCRNCHAVAILTEWARQASKANPNLPPVPDFVVDFPSGFRQLPDLTDGNEP